MSPNRFIKANPTASDLHRSTPLTNISISYAQRNQGKYKAGRIFPAIGVQKKSDKYYVYDKGDLLRAQAKRRGIGSDIPLGGYRISDDQYEAERWSLGKPIADPDRANADPQFDLDAEATEFVTDQVELAKENEWAEEFFATGKWTGASSTGDMTGSANPGSTSTSFLQWNDAASTPIEDLRGEMTTIEGRTGYLPNKLTLGSRVWQALADHPDILDRIKYTERGTFGPDLLASLLGLEEVVVLNAVKNSAAEGAAESVDFIAGKHALLTYTTPAPGLRRPTAGYTFVWTGNRVPLEGVAMFRIRDDQHESDIVFGETWYDFKQVSAELGAFFASAVA